MIPVGKTPSFVNYQNFSIENESNELTKIVSNVGYHIFSNCSTEQLFLLRTVCKRWKHQIDSDQQLWGFLLNRDLQLSPGNPPRPLDYILGREYLEHVKEQKYKNFLDRCGESPWRWEESISHVFKTTIIKEDKSVDEFLAISDNGKLLLVGDNITSAIFSRDGKSIIIELADENELRFQILEYDDECKTTTFKQELVGPRTKEIKKVGFIRGFMDIAKIFL